MAIQDENGNFKGRIKGLSYYKMRGSDKTIVRSAGGASKERIKNDPRFVNTRRGNTEFAGCIAAMQHVRDATFYVARLADFNFSPHLVPIMKKIQDADTKSEWGKRSIFFSRKGSLLSGFNLNRTQPFDHVVRHPLRYSINRKKAEAVIHVPQLMPDINLVLPWKSPMYRLVFSLGMLTDIENVGEGNVKDMPDALYADQRTAWVPATAAMPEQTLTLKLKGPALKNQSLLLAVGLEMGNIDADGEITLVKWQGCAKFLTVE